MKRVTLEMKWNVSRLRIFTFLRFLRVKIQYFARGCVWTGERPGWLNTAGRTFI